MKEFSAATYLREPLISSSGSGGQCVSPPPNRLQHILESNRYSLECEKKPSSVQHSTSFLNLEDMNEDDFKSEDYEAEENANEEDSQKDRQSLEFIKVLKCVVSLTAETRSEEFFVPRARCSITSAVEFH